MKGGELKWDYLILFNLRQSNLTIKRTAIKLISLETILMRN